MTDYQPTFVDLAYAHMVMAGSDGLTVRNPSPDLTYRKQGNALVLIQGDPEGEIHQRTIAVFAAAGYEVRTALENPGAVRQELERAARCGKVLAFGEAGHRELHEHKKSTDQ